MLASLLLFLLFSLPPLAGWWLCFKAPLGRRRFRRSILIAAPIETIWRRLDPRNAWGGWSPLCEIGEAAVVSDDPLRIATLRRPRHSAQNFVRVVETCTLDEANGRMTRAENELDGRVAADAARSDFTLVAHGAATRVTLDHERPINGLLSYELARLGLRRDLDDLQDAINGRDAKSAPLFRFSGWRMAIAGVAGTLLLVALILAPAFYMGLQTIGFSFVTAAQPAMLGLFLFFALVCAAYLTALLILATLVHEMGHAVALAAFGHRGVTVSLIPFGGGVALGARDHANAFEAGVVSLAGPALSAIVALALLPAPEDLSTFVGSLATGGGATALGSGLLALSGAVYAFLTLLINIPNVLPWTGSDGALALGAIFSSRILRLSAAGALTALLAFLFAGVDDLLPFGLLFVALSWWNRKRASVETPGALEAGQRFAVAGGLALTLGLFALEAATLRQIEWLPKPGVEDRV